MTRDHAHHHLSKRKTQRLHCAVVGAGAAGLAAARLLQADGCVVTVLDKGCKVGGRIALRATAHGEFDHGAQYLGGDQPAPAKLLAALCEADQAKPWSAMADAQERPVVIGVPSMQQLARYWATDLDVRCEQAVERIQRSTTGWQLQLRGIDAALLFDAVVVTVPQPQLQALLPDLALSSALQGIVYDPCWTLLWTPAVASLPPLALASHTDNAVINWLAREDLKPGRSGPPRYVIHATAAWSAEHLEASTASVATTLRDEAARWLGIAADARHLTAHRWRYARVRTALGAAQYTLAPGLHYGSDGCLGGGIGAAIDSGHAAAQALLSTFQATTA